MAAAFLRFHRMHHPRKMGEAEINAFLSHLATEEGVSASTQDQALAALLFLYRRVPDGDVGNLGGGVIRARRRQRLPMMLTVGEVRAVLSHLDGAEPVEQGADIRTIHELLGHSDVNTAMVCTHVLNRGPSGVRSPADLL